MLSTYQCLKDCQSLRDLALYLAYQSNGKSISGIIDDLKNDQKWDGELFTDGRAIPPHVPTPTPT